MGKKKKYNAPKDPIKAMKKASRDLEMEMGIRFTYNHPHKSKKQYDRKNKDWKKDIQSLNFLFQIDKSPKKPYICIKNKFFHRIRFLRFGVCACWEIGAHFFFAPFPYISTKYITTMRFKDINPLISKIVETLDVEEIPGIVLTADVENSDFHLACTGKDNMGYIGVALEEIFCTVKEDSESATQSQKVLVRMIFASLVRSYSREELNLRLEAWRRSVENNKDFDGI